MDDIRDLLDAIAHWGNHWNCPDDCSDKYELLQAEKELHEIITQKQVNALEWVEERGHGGGNWRRLIIQKKAELENKGGE